MIGKFYVNNCSTVYSNKEINIDEKSIGVIPVLVLFVLYLG